MQRVRPPRQQKAAQHQQQQQDQTQDTEMAQAQSTQTMLITAEQSLRTVKTLVETSIGCLMFLRGFFSDQTFRDEQIGADGASGSGLADPATQRMRNDAPLTVKQLKKGVTAESDLIIRLWEDGIQDALEKQYLSSLILGIYLNEDDDNDIVEAYTFNFTYGEVEGSKGKIPLLNLTESMQSVSIYNQAGRPSAGEASTSAGAAVAGTLATPKVRTIIDVRKQVQVLIRALITMSQTFQDLPRKRFLTIRLKYTDDVPLDYEPKGFIGGAPQERLLFSTASIADRPDQMSIGSIATGFHGVNIHLATLAPFLRRAPERPGMSLFDLRRADEDLQMEEAAQRRIIWNAEESADMHRDDVEGGHGHGPTPTSASADAARAGPSESERQKREQRRAFKERLGLEMSTVSEPVGVRLDDGNVAPCPPSAVREAEERQARRERGEVLADDEDLEAPVTFVVKHIKEQTMAVLDPETVNAVLAQSIVSPPGGTGTVTATGTSRITTEPEAHAGASQPAIPADDNEVAHASSDASLHTGNVGAANAPRLADSSSVQAPSSPLAHRDKAGDGTTDRKASHQDAQGAQEDGDVEMDLGEDDSLGSEEVGNATDRARRAFDEFSIAEDVHASRSSTGASHTRIEPGAGETATEDSMVVDSSVIHDAEDTRVELGSLPVDSIKSFTPTQTQTQKETVTQERDSIQTSESQLAEGGLAADAHAVAKEPAAESQRSLRPRRSARNEKEISQQTRATENTPQGTQAADTAGDGMDVDQPVESAPKEKDEMGCACDDPVDSGLTMECDCCGKWVHGPCYGYRVTSKRKLPASFECYGCRIGKAELLTEDEKTKMLAELGTLALTRHALDVLYTDGWPGDLNGFAKAIGASLANARTILNKCEAEGFVRRGQEQQPPTQGQAQQQVDGGRQGTSAGLSRSKAKTKAIASKSIAVLKGNAQKHELKKRYFTAGEGVEKGILAPWLDKSSGDAKAASSHAMEEDTSDESLPSSQKGGPSSEGDTGASTKNVLQDKGNVLAAALSSSSQTVVAPLSSTPVRPGLKTIAEEGSSSPLTRSAAAAAAASTSAAAAGGQTKPTTPRSASKRKMSENLDSAEREELARKRRAKTSRPELRIRLGDF
ncbi:hypothetical protein OC835_005266 [Tilletia horrida]|nr:hypothetical protein OC835_005266 [Tilletia horrida]